MNGVACKLTVTEGSSDQYYTNLLVYEVDGTPYCYFARGSASYIIGILANNSGIGLTVPCYRISDGQVSKIDDYYVKSSTPSDYYDNVKSNNYTLSQRS